MEAHRRHNTRFVIFDEQRQALHQNKQGQVLVYKTPENANYQASQKLSSWVVLEQWQWVDDLPAYAWIWTVQKIH
jgi:hypothetical protein